MATNTNGLSLSLLYLGLTQDEMIISDFLALVLGARCGFNSQTMLKSVLVKSRPHAFPFFRWLGTFLCLPSLSRSFSPFSYLTTNQFNANFCTPKGVPLLPLWGPPAKTHASLCHWRQQETPPPPVDAFALGCGFVLARAHTHRHYGIKPGFILTT